MKEQVFGLDRVDLTNVLGVAQLELPSEGFVQCGDEVLESLSSLGQFRRRDTAETDETFKQLIPYVVMKNALGRILCTERTKGGADSRLHNKIAIGIGGHINPVDDTKREFIVEEAMTREVQEETSIGADDIAQVTFMGIINNDTDPVGRVHLGLLYVIEVRGNIVIPIKETHKLRGFMVGRDDLSKYEDRMEVWTKLVYPLISGTFDKDATA